MEKTDLLDLLSLSKAAKDQRTAELARHMREVSRIRSELGEIDALKSQSFTANAQGFDANARNLQGNWLGWLNERKRSQNMKLAAALARAEHLRQSAGVATARCDAAQTLCEEQQKECRRKADVCEEANLTDLVLLSEVLARSRPVGRFP